MTAPRDDFADRVEEAMAAIDDEMARVGADWDALDAALLGDDDGADDDAAVGVDVLTLLAVLRTLPDGAGTAAVLAALEPPPE
ncbi:hypothetical protein [Roseisolibacter sp. H3M3-2]|uniref:hypothetical protein n=1 Tax=Roseisolibacter sp. H3M3-2 TaxID=3031323 RepID=UPI0023DCA70B|nr:hypothetical protein [Roseisolibacter sp. H3M3-2]MDF1501645.1 hypothetical protein [Roseisolibacter sp. H3M3-2]